MKVFSLKSSVINSVSDFIYSARRIHCLVLDAVISFYLFYLFFISSPGFPLLPDRNKALLGAIVFSSVFVLISTGLGYYERSQRTDFIRSLRTSITSSLAGVLSSLFVVYFVYYDKSGRLTFLWASSGALFGLVSLRTIITLVANFVPYRLTMICENDDGLFLCKDSDKRSSSVSLFKSRYQFVQWDDIPQPKLESLRQLRIREIVYSPTMWTDDDFTSEIKELMKSGVRLTSINDFYGKIFERIPIFDNWSKEEVLRSCVSIDILSRFLLRSIDVFLASTALIIVSPILVVSAILIKLESKGSVFFIQPRCGRFGEKFYMYKFRTMKQSLSCVEASGGFTKDSDARVTTIGKILRPLHIDELPQLINIIKGDMSLVGPRPEAYSFANRMRKSIDIYDFRYLIRPGLTGHAQLKIGYCLDSIEDTKKKLSYDLYYIVHYSVPLYFRILIRTFFVVLSRLVLKRNREIVFTESLAQ